VAETQLPQSGETPVVPAAGRADLRGRLRTPLQIVVVVALALLFTSLVLLGSGVSIAAALRLILFGAFSSRTRIADAVMLSAPLLLCAAGLTLTFAAGLYNLGIEGQMAMGGVFAIGAMRLLSAAPSPVAWLGALLAGILGGALWALGVGILRLYGRVSEIFAGLGLNFLATGVALYLVFGPWKRPGTGSMSGTEPLPRAFWLPTLRGLRLAPLAPLVALAMLALVWFVLTRTRWGLEIRAIGFNPDAARRLGVPSGRRLLQSLLACGALAGIAGTLQALAVFHALVPNISSGIGLLALLVVLLVNAQPAWTLPVAALFACFFVGSTQLPLTLGVDSSISGVLQGALVLSALAVRALRPGPRRR
jgi:simple sugar transport system permease protein